MIYVGFGLILLGVVLLTLMKPSRRGRGDEEADLVFYGLLILLGTVLVLVRVFQ